MKIVQETTTTKSSSPLSILDVGCGTGVIGLALADQLNKDATTNVVVVEAIDIDPVAIEVSMENAKRILGSSSQQDCCYKATLCDAKDYVPHHPFDIVVSNPPYIPQADMTTLSNDVIRYESGNALCGGVDGMDVIRVIVKNLPKWCKAGAVCWMEVDPTHPRMIQEWIEEETSKSLGVAFESSYKDMFGKDRFVQLRVM
jgi:release factor glutamine methyltransferase